METETMKIDEKNHPGPRTWPERGQALEVEGYELSIFGAVETDIEISWSNLRSRPVHRVRADLAATSKRSSRTWRGVSMREVLEEAGVLPGATDAVVYSDGGYFARFTVEELMIEQALLAFEVDDRPLSRSDGGPVRLVLPRHAPWHSAKWVRAVALEETLPS